MAIVKTSASAREISDVELNRFRIDEASSDHIISVLTHAYSRPQFSGLREVLQNALDATADGIVDVTMPTPANPLLEVRDTGGGLSPQGFKDMIGSVGASDKRGDAGKAGCLGIGSLAPMSVLDSMTMTSFQGGQRTILHIYKEDDGKLAYTVSEPKACPKKEKDGMLVSMPVPPDMFGAFQDGLDVFKFSPRLCKRIRVDGQMLPPNHVILRETVKVGAHEVVFMTMEGQTSVLSGALVLLNDIPMAASFERFPELKSFEGYLATRETVAKRRNTYANTTMVVQVPAEAGLSFPPSREVVAATRLNAAFLTNAVNRYFELGCEALEKKGLHVGCESAVAMKWQALAISKKRDLLDVREKLRTELNATSKYLHVELSTTHDYRRGDIPVVILHPRAPANLAPRFLDLSRVNKKNGTSGWRMQTASLIPVDLNDLDKGCKWPWDSSQSFTLVTWNRLKDDYGNDWSKVISRSVEAKQALFELGLGGEIPKNEWESYKAKRILLAVDVLPADHPLTKLCTHVEFADTLDGFEPHDLNPFKRKKGEDDEEFEELEDGSIVTKGEKIRHPREFHTSGGSSKKLGFPADKPFLFIEVLRGRLIQGNWMGILTSGLSTYDSGAIYRGFMKFAEDAGLAENLEAVELVTHEARNIKRAKRRLMEGIDLFGQAWWETLDDAEKKYLPFGIARVVMKARSPRLCAYFQKLHDKPGVSNDDPNLAALLRGWDDSPTDKLTRFLNSLAASEKNGSNVIDQFDTVMYSDENTKWTQKTVMGLPLTHLLRPLRRLRAWLDSKTLLARYTKQLIELLEEKVSGESLRLTQCNPKIFERRCSYLDEDMAEAGNIGAKLAP